MTISEHKVHYSDWHIPLSVSNMTLREAHKTLTRVGAHPEEVPLIVRLVENPKLSIPGLNLFHGAVSLTDHDYIHILLGRGLMSEDEAFTIGFTMGSTHEVSESEATLFELISKYLYPEKYTFRNRDLRIFQDALRLASIMDCTPLDQFDYEAHLDLQLDQLRMKLGINKKLLTAYFHIEQQRNPDSKASQRLLST